MEKPVTHVQLVDDSVVVRGMLRELISKNPAFKVVVTSPNGQHGVNDYKRFKPDIVLMDIEMPEKDGLAALKEILEFDAKAKVIMCSSLTQSGAQITVEALRLGAVDCLAKPSSNQIDRTQSFEDELFLKLEPFARRSVPASPAVLNATTTTLKKDTLDDAPLFLRPYPPVLPNNFPLALAIGSSTGGPQALIRVLSKLNKKISLPVFITQHIPQGFSQPLADNIQKNTGFPTHEAKQGMTIEAGHIYIAPGGKHMGIKPGAPKTINILDTPPVNYCKPSVDVMLDSLSEHYGAGILTVVLTGMGADGKEAVGRLVENSKNNLVIAQDKSTSVVWGMPRAVALAGLCHDVLPIDEIPGVINQLIYRKIPVKAAP